MGTELIGDAPKLNRREFIKGLVAGSASVALASILVSAATRPRERRPFVIETSQGYLIVDPDKCSSCLSCMAACSIAHEGGVNLSLARLQVVRDPLGLTAPYDVHQEVCRQCVYPLCAAACPVGAIKADPNSLYARVVDPDKCIGCQRCMEACPYAPSRIQWNYFQNVAQKCDLCGGDPVCVKVCWAHAIEFTTKVPTQFGDFGYKVNLKEPGWGYLGRG